MEEQSGGVFTHEHLGHQVAQSMAALRRQVEAVRAAELSRALEHLGHLDECDREVVRQFGQRMVDQVFRQLGRRISQVGGQAPTEAIQALLLQLLAGAEALPDQADGEALTNATPIPRPKTRRTSQRKLR